MSARVDIVVCEPVGTIHPNLYGHFMEHLGSCIYEGAWVGEDSTIPNAGGVRTDVAEALRAIGAPVIRWPGGCFADDYHWEDGIGPREARPRRVNIHWGDVIETNAFGTHEFVDFCRLVGAEPYLCGNVGSGSPREMRDWVEYCNFPGGSTLSDRRAANGAPEPFGVRYWSVGNENWACGGHLAAEDYAAEYKRFATYLRSWGGTQPYLIACGPSGNCADWTRRFFAGLARGWSPPVHGFSAHYYCGTAGTATEYTVDQWYELLWKAIGMEPLIVEQRAAMDSYDPGRKVGLIVDEWGTWHPAEPGRNPAFLWQQNTVRDALVAALTLDIFNRQAEKIVMGAIAQTINVLQALLLTEGDRMVKTPTYQVYDLYAPHQGATSVRLLAECEAVECVVDGRPQRLPVVAGSASVRDGSLTVTLVNSHATETIETEVRCLGASVADPEVRGLAYPTGDIRAHNTFESPEVVGLADSAPPAGATVELPPASVTRLTYRLG